MGVQCPWLFSPSCGRRSNWVTLDHLSVRWCSQLYLISSLAVPGVSKSWSGVKESVACVAGGIIVPGVLSWRRTCHSKRVKGENPSLTCSQSSRGFAAKKTTALPAKSPAMQVKESVSLRFLLPADPFYFFSLWVTTLWIRHPMYGNHPRTEYEQSLFFLNSPPSKTRETSKWTWA